MRNFLFLSILLAACQAPAALPPAAQALRQPVAFQAADTANARFPDAWKGVWSGKCTNTGPGGKQTYAPVEMRLTIQPKANNDWSWKIEYLGSMNQVRDYTLKPVDPARGHWLIDEHNGILLDNFAVSGSLLSEVFSVGNTLIYGKHELVDAKKLKVELVSFALDAPRKSGTAEFPVSSFKLQSVQDCPLSKN